MRKKLKKNAGLTMVEMLAAVAVMTLLLMMLGTGMQMVMSTYQSIIAQSEVELLVSTAVDALADELRFAREIDVTGGYSNEAAASHHYSTNFAYTSYSFYDDENSVSFRLDDNGQIRAYLYPVLTGDAGKQVLSTGAYGVGGNKSYKKYEVTVMTIEYQTDNTFKIYLKAETDGWNGKKISADTSVTVRCLNPAKDTTT